MRPDIIEKSIVKLNLIGIRRIKFPNGAVSEAADYTGYRAEGKDGSIRIFLMLQPGDLSVDWLDITAYSDQFIISVSGGDLLSKPPED
jgi:hypothetical protein